jgi:transcriptional regulator with XRE-family HTH domain
MDGTPKSRTNKEAPERVPDWLSRLREVVAKDGRPRAEISRAAGWAERYLSNVLTTGRQPSFEKFGRLCLVLNVSLDYILFGVGPEAVDNDEVRLLRIWKRRSSDARRRLLAYLEVDGSD